MTQKTTIYFDVDGVFAAWPKRGSTHDAGWGDYRSTRVLEFDIMHSPSLVSAVNKIAAREDVDPVWLTTWCNFAPTALAPRIGLNGRHWRVASEDVDIDHDAWYWWKISVVERDMRLHENRVVWIDDDIMAAEKMRQLDWVDNYEDILLVSPDTNTGLSPVQIEMINEFLDE